MISGPAQIGTGSSVVVNAVTAASQAGQYASSSAPAFARPSAVDKPVDGCADSRAETSADRANVDTAGDYAALQLPAEPWPAVAGAALVQTLAHRYALPADRVAALIWDGKLRIDGKVVRDTTLAPADLVGRTVALGYLTPVVFTRATYDGIHDYVWTGEE